MDPTTLDRLEFAVVLDRLGALTESPGARRQALDTRPWTDADDIQRHGDAVDEILDLLDSGGSLPLGGFDDCGEPLARLGAPAGVLAPAQWMQVRGLLAIGVRIHRQVSEARERMPVCWRRVATINSLRHLTASIGRIFDEDGQVRDSASKELRGIRSRIRRLERDIEKAFDRLLARFRDDDVLQGAYWTERDGRRVVPVRAGARGKLDGLVQATSSTGETLFIEPFDVVEPTNRLAETQNAEREEVRRILAALADAARGDLPALETNRDALVQIDLWHARARLAHLHTLHRPDIGPGRTLHLIAAHHPLLYLNEPEASVPLDMRLDPENRALVVTGPNTGGKTTALKTVGLLAIMAQSAIPIPAGVDSRLPIFPQVLAEVGDEQSVSAGLSTFSAHIRRISWILDECEEGALVLLDELGKATDPLQAGALGRAILEALIRRGALTLVTTHLATLKDWAHEHPNGRNASYRLHPETHRPLYEMHLDTPGISEAFTIARAEGLPGPIVDAAIEGMPKEERDLSELLEMLHQREESLRRALKKAGVAKEKAQREREALKSERARIARRSLDADKELETRYKGLLDKARADVEKRIANLPSRQALSQARDRLARDQKEAEKALAALEEREKRLLQSSTPAQAEPQAPYEPAEGDWVTVGKGDQAGRIEKINTSRGQATILIGGLQVTTKIGHLRRAKSPETDVPQRDSGSLYTGGTPAETVPAEIELIGKRVADALDELDRYLDRATLSHHTKVRVVHGYGTGALRSGIHEFLAQHPHAESFRLAPDKEGGGAVTLVHLR